MSKLSDEECDSLILADDLSIKLGLPECQSLSSSNLDCTILVQCQFIFLSIKDKFNHKIGLSRGGIPWRIKETVIIKFIPYHFQNYQVWLLVNKNCWSFYFVTMGYGLDWMLSLCRSKLVTWTTRLGPQYLNQHLNNNGMWLTSTPMRCDKLAAWCLASRHNLGLAKQ